MMGLLCSPCQTTVMVNTMYKSYHEQLNCIQTLPSVHLYDILGHSDVQYLLLERNSFSRILSLSKGDTCHTFLRKKRRIFYFFIEIIYCYTGVRRTGSFPETEKPPQSSRHRRKWPPIPQKLFVFQDYYNSFDNFAGERENKNTSVSAVGALVNTSTDIFLHFVVCSL